MKRAATITALIVLTGIVLHGLLPSGMAQVPTVQALDTVGRFNLVAVNANAQVNLFVIDTQTGRLWQSNPGHSWRAIDPPRDLVLWSMPGREPK